MNTENKLLQYIYSKYHIQDIKDLENKLLELSSIYDVNQRFLSARDISEIADLLLLVPMGRFLISKIFMVLKIEERIIVNQKGKWKIPDSILQMLFKSDIIRPMLLEEAKTKIPDILADEFDRNKIQLIIPLSFHDERMGFVLLGNKMDQSTYSVSEIQTLMTIFNMNTPFLLNLYMLDTLKTKNVELANHVQILNTILETSSHLDSLFDKEKVINLFLLTLMGRLTITRYLWIICDDIHESGNFSLLSEKKLTLSRETILKISRHLKLKLGAGTQSFILSELIEEQDFDKILVIPYWQEASLKSLLILGPKMSGQSWTQLETDFASILLAQVMHILDNLDLLEEKIEKELMEKELAVARSIQNQLLPSSIPAIEGLELSYYNEPSRQVGGDYCDIILKNNFLYIVIADVSGKSVPAALIMANVQSAIHILTDFDLNLSEIVFKLNNQLFENTASDKFVTLFIGKLDLDTFELEYINAGHNPPYHYDRQKDNLTPLDKGGLLLGMMKNVSFEVGSTQVAPGDLVFMYTDGITETINPMEEEWGEENLMQFIKRHADLSAEKFQTQLLTTLSEFSDYRKIADDDITYIYLKRKA